MPKSKQVKKVSTTLHDAKTIAALKALKFEGVESNDPEAFNAEWDHARGFFARVAASLLALNDMELAARFLRTPETAHAMMDVYDSIRDEQEYLKIHTQMLDACSGRILAVAHRANRTIMKSKHRSRKPIGTEVSHG